MPFYPSNCRQVSLLFSTTRFALFFPKYFCRQHRFFNILLVGVDGCIDFAWCVSCWLQPVHRPFFLLRYVSKGRYRRKFLIPLILACRCMTRSHLLRHCGAPRARALHTQVHPCAWQHQGRSNSAGQGGLSDGKSWARRCAWVHAVVRRVLQCLLPAVRRRWRSS